MLVVLAGFLALTAMVDGQDQSGAHISLKSHGSLPSLSPISHILYCVSPGLVPFLEDLLLNFFDGLWVIFIFQWVIL